MINIMPIPILSHLPCVGQRERCLDEGTFLFHQGDPVSHLFVVLDGLVELIRYQEDGSPVVLQRAATGAAVADASLFSQTYHCGGVSMVRSRVLSVPMPGVRRLLGSSPEFAQAWAQYLAIELQGARLRSEILTLRTVAERLDAWLLGLGRNLPPKGEWKSLALEIGVSPEALYRELARRRAA